MAGYADQVPAQAIDDLVALLRSWARPPDEVELTPLPPDHLSDALLNPEGPDPEFPSTTELYVGVEAVKSALDAGARVVIADARVASDYLVEHIAGAVSVPFFDAGDLAGQLPEDAWIVTYCACPHAEARAAATALSENGRPQVRVLDEGLPGWLAAGYPTRSGPEP